MTSFSGNMKFKAIIRPYMTYDSPIWRTAVKSDIAKLQVSQNKCLGLSIEVLAGVLFLTDFNEKLNTTLSVSLPVHPIDLRHTHLVSSQVEA